MKIKEISVLVIMAAFMLVSSLNAENTVKTKKLNSREPIEIISDRMDAYNEKKLVIFSGNAVATQGDKEIKSNQLLLYYKKETDKKEKIGTGKTEGTGDLEKIEAKGNVVVTQKEKVATGDEAVYFQESGQIIMTGNATLRDGKNLIKGDKIIVFVNEDRGVVESDPKKRVKAIIYPDEQNDNKKK